MLSSRQPRASSPSFLSTLSSVPRYLLALLSLACILSCENRPDRACVIAYIGRYTDVRGTASNEGRSQFDVLHETVLRDKLSRLGDSIGVQFELRPFDNQRDPRVSDSLYRLIAGDSTISLIIDNTWGEHLIPCAPFIRERHLPVLSMNADRDEGQFGSSVIFLGNDDNVPVNLNAYLRNVLGLRRVVMISEEDYALHDRFMEVMDGERGVGVRPLITLSRSDSTSVAPAIRDLIDYYRANPAERNVPLLMNVHNGVGDRILAAIDSTLDSLTIVGGAYVASLRALQKFGRARESSGNRFIVMGRPTDAMSRSIALDLDRYRAAQPEVFSSPSAPLFMQRCETVVDLVRAMFSDSGMAANPARHRFASRISSFAGHAITGTADLYEFDSAGNLLTDVFFTSLQGETHGSDFRSLPIQLNRQRREIPDLQFGLDIQSIHDVDVDGNTFKADFFYWVKVDTTFRRAEEELLFRNLIESESSPVRVMEKIDGSTLWRLYKVSGTFGHQYVLRDFPLDEQELVISLEVLSPTDRLRVSFDKESIEIDPSILGRFRVQAWQKLKYFVTVDNNVRTSLRGDPELHPGTPAVFKTIAFRLQVKRKFLGPFLEIVLPLALIGFVAISLLFVNDISFANLGDVIVGTFLGIITFSIVLSSITPSSDYLTRADILFWATFCTVLISFMTVIIVNARFKGEDLEKVDIRRVRLGLSIAYPIAVVGILIV